MTDAAAVNTKKAAYFNIPSEDDYGFAQAIKVGSVIYVSGQFSHDRDGRMVASAPVDETGRPTSFLVMGAQMRVAYANAISILERFGAALQNVVEETLYVIDVDAAFLVAGEVRKDAYGNERPHCASTLIGVSRLFFPEQLVAISLKAVLPDREQGAMSGVPQPPCK